MKTIATANGDRTKLPWLQLEQKSLYFGHGATAGPVRGCHLAWRKDKPTAPSQARQTDPDVSSEVQSRSAPWRGRRQRPLRRRDSRRRVCDAPRSDPDCETDWGEFDNSAGKSRHRRKVFLLPAR